MRTMMLAAAAFFVAPATAQDSDAEGAQPAEACYEEACRAAEAGEHDESLRNLRYALERGLADAGRVYIAPELFPLRDLPAFRELLAEKAARPSLCIVPANETGEPLELGGRVVAAGDGKPIAGARIYLYQTDAKGIYAQGEDPSSRPRLFGHLTTRADGRFTLRTIRPGSYPGSENPQHIHYCVTAKGFRANTAEVVFDDDPLLGAEQRAHAERAGWPIAKPVKGEDGLSRCEVVIRLQAAG